ncbi:MAG: ribosomal protein L19p [Pedosphaera sp.]|nr:ribosomal protein L19p [Pedosphaera sp.]
MGTLNSFYIRTKDSSSIAAIQKKFPSAQIEPGQEFVGVTLAQDAFEPPTTDLIALSASLGTDVIWLSFQSTVDAFEFHHWWAGTSLRSLVFGCYKEERTWDRAEGGPEAWERAAFFETRSLQHCLRSAKTDVEKHECERIWREAEILPGRTEPNIDARESARAAAEHYNFPGWS